MKRLVVLSTLVAGMVLWLAACGGAANSRIQPAAQVSAGQPSGQEPAAEDIGVGTPGRVRLVEFYADW